MSEWKKSRLGDCCEIIAGATPSTSVADYWDGDIFWATPKDLSDLKGSYISDTPRKLTREGLDTCAASILPVGSVLFSSRAPIGYVAINTVPMATNQGFKSFIPKPESVHAKFLYWWLRTNRSYLESLGNGATFKEVSKAIVARIEIPLPPLAKQRTIAEVLDRAEALRAKRRATLAQLDSLTQAIFLDLFGDPVTNSRGWPLKKFGDVGSLDRGISRHRPRNAPELLGGSYPLVQTGEVANCDGYIRSHTSTYSDVGLQQSKLWPAGTLCITIAANIAKTGILKFDACFPDSVVGFRSEDPATVEFVRTWLSFLQKSLEDSAPEFAQKNINLAILRGLDIPFPPLPLQRAFARSVAVVEKLKISHRFSLTKLDALFATLQHSAFRGEL